MAIFGLYLFLAIAMVSGVAIDAARFQTLTVQMQNAADSAAHAALITRRTSSASTAIDRAIAIAQGHMPSAQYGTVLAPADVQFGIWDSSDRLFTPDSNATDAVHVTTRQTAASGNPFRTSLLRLLGIRDWSATRSAVFRNTVPACQEQGIISQGDMSFKSRNAFYSPVCLHTNSIFNLSNDNFFEAGTGVSVTDPSKMAADPSVNPGLSAALSYRTSDVARMIKPIPAIISGLTTPGSTYIPSYITDHTAQDLVPSGNIFEVRASNLMQGRIYRAHCGPDRRTDPQDVVVRQNELLSSVVIVTNCKVYFEDGVRLEDVVVATSNTEKPAISGGHEVVLGRNDNCAPGGGAQLVTSGSVHFASAVSVHGGQMLASGDIHLAAKADGTVGNSIVAGGKFVNTSQSTWRSCPSPSRENKYYNYFASLVQ